MPRNEELAGRFLGEKVAFENESGPRVIIGVMEQESSKAVITIKGESDRDELRFGMVYRFMGQWREHHRYGRQFWFSSYTIEEPADEESVIAYLCQCDGVGRVTAGSLWDTFGPDAVKVLREEPARACEGIPRFSIEKAEAASVRLKQWEKTEKTKLELIGLLNGRGFPKDTVRRAISKLGAAAAKVIRRNPYYLMTFRGCGFLGTDRMYLDLGNNPAAFKRQALCGWYKIASESNGDTWFPEGMIVAEIRNKVSGANANPERALELAIRSGYLSRTNQGGKFWLAERKKAVSEERLAAYVRDAVSDQNLCAQFLPAVKESVSEHQYEIAKAAIGQEGGVSIIGGSPGTGKTHSAAALIKAATYKGHFSVAAAAPTGKAAVRMTEALRANDIHLQATTIHGLLGVVNNDDGGWTFNYCESNPLPYRIVFLDEMSMADTDLMRSLFAARGAGTHFVIIGDIHQLPPVGHGAPLRDMINSGVPYGELTEIRRNSGRIVRACAEIRDGKRFGISRKLDIEAGENLVCESLGDPERIIEWIEKTVKEQKQNGLDPVWDCQVLVPVNKKSELSRKKLNDRLQESLNPAGHRVSGNPFRVGDKVINLQNSGFPDAITGVDQYVANGEQGEVLEVNPNKTIVRLSSPDRKILIPHKPQRDKKKDGKGDDGESESKGSVGSWDLAYAISGHKSQGSEWPVVIVVLDSYGGARRVCSKEWIYTCCSRAKRACFLVGPEEVAHSACRRTTLAGRKTFLAERIKGTYQRPLTENEIEEMFSCLS